jgi:ankyrin repeat protein
LRSLPKTLDETYERILLSIEEEHRQKVVTALRWITYRQDNYSGFTLVELADAVVIDPKADPPFNPAERLGDPDWLVQILASLVVVSNAPNRIAWIDGEQMQINLAHFSVKEYLESYRILEGPASIFHMTANTSHKFLAEICILYIKCYALSESKTSSKQDFELYPLLWYTCLYWNVHVQAVEDLDSSDISDLILQFLSSDVVLSSWLSVCYPDDLKRDTFEGDGYEVGTALYYASLSGLHNVMKILLNSGPDVNEQTGRHGTALGAAIYGGEIKAVDLLLQSGADVNIVAGEFGTALHILFEIPDNPFLEDYDGLLGAILSRLLEAGADPNIEAGRFGTALQAASCEGTIEHVKLLLKAGANPNAQAGFFGTALQAASYKSQLKIMKELLQNGADVNTKTGRYGTALQGAAYSGIWDAVKLLLDAGADINIVAGKYGTALQSASYGSTYDSRAPVVRQLLDAGADVNKKCGKYGTALQAALSAEGWNKQKSKFVKMLLEAGADVTTEQQSEIDLLKKEPLEGSGEESDEVSDYESDFDSSSSEESDS